jgi:hypothetical protein
LARGVLLQHDNVQPHTAVQQLQQFKTCTLSVFHIRYTHQT